MYSIYKVINTVNGKVYIGLSKDPHKRWRCHLRIAMGSGQKQHFHEAINKHKLESFAFEIIEIDIHTRKEANQRERHWIKEHRSHEREFGYNGTPGGDGGPTFFSRHHTTEFKQRMSEIQRNRSPEWCENFKKAQQNRSEEWRQNLSLAQQNRPPVKDTTREKMREAWQRRKARGWIPTLETRQRISKVHKDKICPPQTRDGVSDARKLKLLEQDVAVLEKRLVISARAMKRHIQRIESLYWETHIFKDPVVEQSASDLRKRLQRKESDLS